MALRVRTSFIDGQWLPQSGRVVVRENPGRIDQIATRYCAASPGDARRAMDCAAEAFPNWSNTPAGERIEFLNESLDALERSSKSIEKLITAENGKTLGESRSEVAAALGDGRHHLDDARKALRVRARRRGGSISTALRPEPVGVYALITPWNFPLATIARKLIPALAFGNTVVVKPSELTSGVACEWIAILAKQGLPSGVVNLVLGRGTTVGRAIAEHEALRGISFTGSNDNGLLLARMVAGRDVRLQLEMGGKNSLLVLADADLEAATDAALVAGFSCAGQWCTGTGRVIVESSVANVFCELLVKKVNRLVVGPGHLKRSDVGALISKNRLVAARKAIKTAVTDGACVACGGKEWRTDGKRKGYFFEPTVLTKVSETMAVFSEELFLPILPVAIAEGFEDGLRMANQGSMGLSASLFTKKRKPAEEFCRRIEAGIAHVNLHTAYRVSDLPVAAWRDSGRGVPECGDFASAFFTKPRAVYTKF